MNHINRLINSLVFGMSGAELLTLPLLYSSVGFHSCALCLAGHNKWSKIKGPKAIADHKRATKIGKLCLEIISAIRVANDNRIESNPRLASVISRAKSFGVPKSTIENAINSALKKGNTDLTEKVLYEGRGSSGYSILIEAITDNKKRTRPEIRTILTQSGGQLGDSGSVMFQFDTKGVVMVSKDSLPKESKFDDVLEIAIDVGAEEVSKGTDDSGCECYLFICEPQDLESVTEAASKTHESIDISQSVISYIPNTYIALSPSAVKRAMSLVSTLEGHPDVIRVYTNFREDSEK